MIMTAITWTGIGIALLILALLIIPFQIIARGSLDAREGLDYQLMIDWALGLVSVRAASGSAAALHLAGFRAWPIPLKAREKKKPRKKRPAPFTWLGWTGEHFSQIQSILRRFARASFLRGYLVGKIGLADPSDTALVGLLCRLIQVRTRRFHMAVTTIYDDEQIHIRAKIQATLIIGYLGIVALGLLLDKQIRVMLSGVPQT